MDETTKNKDQNTGGQSIIINQKNNTNGVGVAGFILSILALLIGCVPILGWFIWFLGLLLSFIGVFNRPRGLAIAGLIISLIGIILLIFVFSHLALMGATSEGLELE